MWVKKFFWNQWRDKKHFYAPCPGFCDDPDQRRFRFRRWCDLGHKISWRRGGCSKLYRLYWHTHPKQHARMMAKVTRKFAKSQQS